MVYVWLLDELRQQYTTAQLSTNFAAAMGNKVDDFPVWEQVRADFDAQLISKPEDSEGNVILRALRLR